MRKIVIVCALFSIFLNGAHAMDPQHSPDGKRESLPNPIKPKDRKLTLHTLENEDVIFACEKTKKENWPHHLFEYMRYLDRDKYILNGPILLISDTLDPALSLAKYIGFSSGLSYLLLNARKIDSSKKRNLCRNFLHETNISKVVIIPKMEKLFNNENIDPKKVARLLRDLSKFCIVVGINSQPTQLPNDIKELFLSPNNINYSETNHITLSRIISLGHTLTKSYESAMDVIQRKKAIITELEHDEKLANLFDDEQLIQLAELSKNCNNIAQQIAYTYELCERKNISATWPCICSGSRKSPKAIPTALKGTISSPKISQQGNHILVNTHEFPYELQQIAERGLANIIVALLQQIKSDNAEQYIRFLPYIPMHEIEETCKQKKTKKKIYALYTRNIGEQFIVFQKNEEILGVN